ncbi:MAG: hypothetical protein E7448_02405 [Ruminococcaceae bacterium]|nr:hypothetical protein [Oscillospiraceae bacterium]
MIKRIFLTITALMLVLTLAACGEAPTTNETINDPSVSVSEPQQSQTAEFSPLVLVDNDQFTVKITGIDPKGTWGYTLKVFLENKTDKELMFSTDDVSVNGFMCDPFWAVSVAAGKKANEEISFSEGDFKKNGIESVEEIVFTLSIYDSNDFMADDLLEQAFTVKP